MKKAAQYRGNSFLGALKSIYGMRENVFCFIALCMLLCYDVPGMPMC